jgi:hypothetical protein
MSKEICRKSVLRAHASPFLRAQTLPASAVAGSMS